MKKMTVFIIICLAFFTAGKLLAGNTTNYGKNVYAIFSENFNGVKMSLHEWTGQMNGASPTETPDLTDRDRAEVYLWPSPPATQIQLSDPNITYTTLEDPQDGNEYWRITTSGGGNWWDGMSVTFVDSFSSETFRNMSDYAGGTIEFWARSSSVNATGYRIGITATSGDKWINIGNIGFSPNGTWQKIRIELRDYTYLEAKFAVVATENIKNAFLFFTNNMNSYIDLDGIVWRKPGSAVSFDAILMDVGTTTPSSTSYLTWDENVLQTGWKAANQYVELSLDCIPGDNWGVQVYTDCTAALNPSANPAYTGTMTSAAPMGLIDTSDTAKVLPMAWRITDKLLPFTGTNDPVMQDYDQTLNIGFFPGGYDGLTYVYPGLYDSGSTGPNPQFYHTWFYIKDKAQFGSEPDVSYGGDYIRAWSRKGFHAAAGSGNYFGMKPGGMVNMRIAPKLYFAADFSQATTPKSYENNSIIIELFYE